MDSGLIQPAGLQMAASTEGTLLAEPPFLRRAKRGDAPSMDALIAASAELHGLTLVTRNAADFQTSVRSLFNLWT